MTTALRDFFDLNNEIVFFVYGQVFFVLGLAIALQSRRHSRLELARSLRWLAAFGLAHGFHEWGLLLVPIQALYLPPDVVVFLRVMRVLLLGLSFAALFQFGADLLRDRWPWLLSLPLIITAIGSTILIVAATDRTPSIGIWEQWASIGIRYSLGLPAGLLAALGLRHQAKRQIMPLGLDRIYRMLRIGGLALAAYALLAGLIVPYASFFPANVLNYSLLVDVLGVPVYVFRSIAGLVLAVAVIRALEVFDVEIDRMIEQMQLEQGLAAERERIGRELHDGAIQRVYTAGLIIESARRKIEDDGVVGQRLDRAMTALNEAIASLRAYMTDLRSVPLNLSLQEGLEQQANDPRLIALMDISLKMDWNEPPGLNPSEITHILAIVGEGLANAARHGQAEHVWVRTTRANGQLVLQISDNGRGFVLAEQDQQGYGLRNMRDRARLLGGELTVESEPGRGTEITLTVPLEA